MIIIRNFIRKKILNNKKSIIEIGNNIQINKARYILILKESCMLKILKTTY